MVYCGRNHQIAHFADHKHICTAIKAARDDLEKEEEKFRASSDKDPIVHVTNVLTPEKEKFLRSRVHLIAQIYSLETREALEQALEHHFEMLRLNPKDDYCGVRNSIPAIMLRLGRDRECYAFLKSWNMIYKGSCDIWSRPELPRFNMEGVDVFESVDEFLITKDGFTDIGMIVPLCLMKLRIFLDGFFSLIQGGVPAIGIDAFPLDIVQSLERQLGSLATEDFWSHPRLADNESRLAKVKQLASQIKALYGNIGNMNSEFWPMFLRHKELDLSRHLRTPNFHESEYINLSPRVVHFMNNREAALVSGWNHASWLETNAALWTVIWLSKFPGCL